MVPTWPSLQWLWWGWMPRFPTWYFLVEVGVVSQLFIWSLLEYNHCYLKVCLTDLLLSGSFLVERGGFYSWDFFFFTLFIAISGFLTSPALSLRYMRLKENPKKLPLCLSLGLRYLAGLLSSLHFSEPSLKIYIYLFLVREDGRKKGRET